MSNVIMPYLSVWDRHTDWSQGEPHIIVGQFLDEDKLNGTLRSFVCRGAERDERPIHPHELGRKGPCFISLSWKLPQVWLSYYLYTLTCEEGDE